MSTPSEHPTHLLLHQDGVAWLYQLVGVLSDQGRHDLEAGGDRIEDVVPAPKSVDWRTTLAERTARAWTLFEDEPSECSAGCVALCVKAVDSRVREHGHGRGDWSHARVIGGRLSTLSTDQGAEPER